MNIYVYILIALYFLSLIEFFLHSQIERWNLIIMFFVGIFIVLFAGLREIGYDYSRYNEFYSFLSFNNRSEYLVEFGFTALIVFFRFLGAPFFLFLSLVALFCVSSSFNFFKKLSPLPLLSIFIFFPITFMISDMGQIRNGIALAFVMWAYVDLFQNKEKLFFSKALIACLFHNSAIIVIPIYLIIKYFKKPSTLLLSVLFIILISFMFIDIRDYLIRYIQYFPSTFQDKIIFYTHSDLYGEKLGFNISLISRIIILVILYLFRDTGEEKFPFYTMLLKFYFAGVVIYILFNSIAEFAIRFSNYFKMLEYLILPMFIIMTKNKVIKIFIYIFIFLYVGWSLYKLLIDPELSSAFLPYKCICM